jgi:UDPglucose 6-dehydrogenase
LINCPCRPIASSAQVEFRSPDFGALKHALRSAVIFDGRNMVDPRMVRGMGFEYLAIGR